MRRRRLCGNERWIQGSEDCCLGMPAPKRIPCGGIRIDDHGHAAADAPNRIRVPSAHQPGADDCDARAERGHAAGLAPMRIDDNSGGVLPSSLTRLPVAAAW